MAEISLSNIIFPLHSLCYVGPIRRSLSQLCHSLLRLLRLRSELVASLGVVVLLRLGASCCKTQVKLLGLNFLEQSRLAVH